MRYFTLNVLLKMKTFGLFYCRRTNANVLELSEISLDVNLIDNAIRYTFADAPILAVSIEESSNGMIVLVATVNSIHKLKFTHPDSLHKSSSDDSQAYSIFHAACSGQGTRDTVFHVIGHTSSSREFSLSSV